MTPRGWRADAAPGYHLTVRATSTALLTAALATALAGCGASTASPVPAPSTTATTITPPSPTVPSFGAPADVEPSTAANASANASGACAGFSVLYLQAAQTPVAASAATPQIAKVQRFAQAAATGAPAQWAQLSHDVDALVDAVASPQWAAVPNQDQLPAVQAVYADCRPLQ